MTCTLSIIQPTGDTHISFQRNMAWKVCYLVLITTFESIIACNCISTARLRKRDIQTNRPIIGVLAQTTEGKGFMNLGPSYIAASYVKYLESSGARVVPIKNDLSEDEIEKLFYSINGVLFPGGRASLISSGYARTGRIIYKLAMKSFDQGDYFPLWGTCLGFRYLFVLVDGTFKMRTLTDAENLIVPLNFSRHYLGSRMFRDIPKDLAKFLSEAPTTANFHNWSVTVKAFKENKNLSQFFNILSTNNDRNGIEFLSTIEAKKYPFYGTQWHPEKNSFEWPLWENIPHQAMSIKVAQYMSNFFVNEARYSKHKFPTIEEEQSALIYNYCPVYTGKVSKFDQCYIFNKTSQAERVRI